jgi:protein SCO1/2
MQDFCPLMDRRFAEVQKAVAADPALARSVHLVSVSFDPARDTPPVLKAHAKTLGANPELWSFLTAAEPAIETFASRFGVSIMREGSDASITHNLRTAVIVPAGRLAKIYSGSDWSPETLLGDLRNAGRR